MVAFCAPKVALVSTRSPGLLSSRVSQTPTSRGLVPLTATLVMVTVLPEAPCPAELGKTETQVTTLPPPPAAFPRPTPSIMISLPVCARAQNEQSNNARTASGLVLHIAEAP